MTARKGFRTCTKCERNRAERFFRGDRGKICATCRRKKVALGARAQRIPLTYGISLEEYDELLAVQGGRCAICKGVRPYALDVDHDHLMERFLRELGCSVAVARRRSVRGLLCKQDNRRLLPAVKDSVVTLQNAIAYLNAPPAFSVLSSLPPTGLGTIQL